MRKRLLTLLLCASWTMASAQDYSNAAGQQARLQALSKTHPQLVTLKSLTKTSGGKDIWLLTIGTGKTETKPAIAVIGGVEGNHLMGTELAIGFAENLLAKAGTDSVKNLLAKTTYYVFPNMSPDAMEQYFASLKYERMGNAVETDDDRDGKLNEDAMDDLDRNGKITWMRVSSPIGDYRLHPDDPRVLIKADSTKGERGQYLLLQEGMDNDKDGKLNEDGAGGIAFNKNLTYMHRTFAAGAGDYPASEKETRALLDFLYDAFNVYAVVSFGSNNNLSTPIAFNPAAAQQRITAGWAEADTRANSAVSELYNKTTGLKDAPKTNTTGGDVLSWGYFHYGRLSFSTPGWWIPKAKPDTAKKEKAFTIEDASANALRWFSQQGITEFTEWSTVNHPDYPGQKVEVGGLSPFVLFNPPYKMAADAVKKHTEFLVRLASLQPEIIVMNLKTEKLGNNLTRVTADIVNKGLLPTHSKIGERSYFVKKMKVALNTTGKQEVVGGKKIQLFNGMAGNSSQQVSWLVKGTGKCTLEAGCPTGGITTIDINL